MSRGDSCIPLWRGNRIDFMGRLREGGDRKGRKGRDRCDGEGRHGRLREFGGENWGALEGWCGNSAVETSQNKWKWSYQGLLTMGVESQLVISDYQTRLPGAGQGCLKLNSWQRQSHENPWRNQTVSKTMGYSMKWCCIAEDNTHTTHLTWKSPVGAYMESLPLCSSIFGSGMYSAGH